jgi:hypothetical protein
VKTVEVGIEFKMALYTDCARHNYSFAMYVHTRAVDIKAVIKPEIKMISHLCYESSSLHCGTARNGSSLHCKAAGTGKIH